MLVPMARPQISMLATFVSAILAGALIGGNVSTRPGRFLNVEVVGTDLQILNVNCRGWPCVHEEWFLDERSNFHDFDTRALLANIVFAIGIIVVVGGSVELWVRRRKT
jgi:hypothetical protein